MIEMMERTLWIALMVFSYLIGRFYQHLIWEKIAFEKGWLREK